MAMDENIWLCVRLRIYLFARPDAMGYLLTWKPSASGLLNGMLDGGTLVSLLSPSSLTILIFLQGPCHGPLRQLHQR